MPTLLVLLCRQKRWPSVMKYVQCILYIISCALDLISSHLLNPRHIGASILTFTLSYINVCIYNIIQLLWDICFISGKAENCLHTRLVSSPVSLIFWVKWSPRQSRSLVARHNRRRIAESTRERSQTMKDARFKVDRMPFSKNGQIEAVWAHVIYW